MQNGNKKCSDFSIENLLKSEEPRKRKHPEFDGHSQQKCPENDDDKNVRQNQPIISTRLEIESQTLSWLNCTRFNPPKLARSRKRGSTSSSVQERRGRGPRIPFSPGQIAVLENTFANSRYLSGDSIARLANALDLSNDRVKIWFQNRRARFKRERSSLQGQLPICQANLKSTNATTNHHFHWTPVVSLKDQHSQPIFVGSRSSFLPQLCHHIMHA